MPHLHHPIPSGRSDPRSNRWTRALCHAAVVLALPLAACTATPAPPPPPPLYLQLGGVQGIEVMTASLLQRMATDPRTRRTFDGVNLRTLTSNLSAHLCQVADGPCVYEGENMRNAHADLGLTGSEFEATVQMLRDELDRRGVSAGAKNELLRRLGPMRRDMVSPSR